MADFPLASRSRYSLRFLGSDLIVATLAPVVALAIREPGIFSSDRAGLMPIYIAIAAISTIAMLWQFSLSDILARYLSGQDVRRIFKAAFGAAVLTAAVSFSMTRLEAVPRSLPLIHFMVLSAALVGVRYLRRNYLVRRARLDAVAAPSARENILVIGANQLAWFYIRIVESFSFGEQKVVALLDPNPRLRGRSLGGHAVLGSPDTIGAILDEYAEHGVNIVKVMIAIPEGQLDANAWADIRGQCAARRTPVDFIAHQFGLPAAADLAIAARGGEVEPSPFFSPVVFDDFYSPEWIWLFKRGVDFIFALFIAVVLSPLILLVALAVFVANGSPMVFWQERLGRGGKPLFIYKFRTLKPPYDAKGRKIADADRITHTGKFLRALRLDELPQLYNVLRGDMSLVGPRPLLPIDQPKDPSLRLSVRPGVTGWAQINGGKLIEAEEKAALDEWYIRNISLWLDLKIILKTVLVACFGDRRGGQEVSDVSAPLPVTQPASETGDGAPTPRPASAGAPFLQPSE